MSGNASGAGFYTDGHQDAPMLPRPLLLSRCAACHTFYWLKDTQVKASAAGVRPISELSELEYLAAIDAGLGRGAEEEKTLRVRAWWRQNDRFRRGLLRRLRPWRLTSAGRANMLALIDLLDETQPAERLMKAELLRQLGEFDRARTLLSTTDGWAAAHIVDLCDRRDARVRRIT